MRVPSPESQPTQLDLLSDEPVRSPPEPLRIRRRSAISSTGGPHLVPIEQIEEDPANPRVEFPEIELKDLASDIRMRGVLVPLVVHPADANGRHRLHFGAMRLRAANLAGLRAVPVVVRDAPADRYAQVAENRKRHNLSPLDLARFIRSQMNAGESQTTIARQLGMNLTTVAHHLSLLELPPVLDNALRAGRCTSPRTLHELGRLHDRHPEQVEALLDASAPVTRDAVKTLRARVDSISATGPARLIGQAMAACDRLEKLLVGIDTRGTAGDRCALQALQALQARLVALSRWSGVGSDRQTP
ncbi:MAG TPA: ParB/RepB/Spo0J family partition protein [Piscinibacter sp.]|uniref:ParB/RepB/Spo0J family partition protein n=1 Tax=Piscinibacter sp. TaxID=1903157 RepID=UPI0011D974D0|nr:MAG: ParB/RepB/Spo0J family partition protein [Burkholderiaceae bacterium]HNJ82146.1 ParB/RepB/Spo0J family partition protein [Piscinibacter sp.]HNK17195.1 ParB/RepB/Spo0J family partition protein [Piscinibacter sp.]